MSERLKSLAEAGVSIWLDDLSRERIETGNLDDLVENRSVVGVTTNPTIFAAALSNGERYDAQVRELVQAGASVDDVVFELTTHDVREACDILHDTWKQTDGIDGRVSIEVPPGLAFDTDATIAAAKKLWTAVDRPNLLIKIPATTEGMPAISAVVAEGISVNVTLIFSLERYGEVMDAFLDGVERARVAGHDLSRLGSVASFFVSRVDTEVDKRLDKLGSAEASELRGKAAIANARLAFQRYEGVFSGERWAALAEAGAKPQRPLWASTSTKDPAYPDTLEAVEERAAETWDRGVSRAGVARQLAAILTQPDRTRELHTLDLPALVVHGLADKMVHVSGGRATARAIPGAELLLVPGMGHDLPGALTDTFVDAIHRTAGRA